MLKRRSRIQKYISTLKKKQLKRDNLKNHTVLQHKIEQVQNQPKLEHQPPRIQIQEEPQQAVWNDDDIQPNMIQLTNANKFKKLINFGLDKNTTEEAYERQLGKLYKQKHQKVNWADQTDDIEEKDVADYLNEEFYYNDNNLTKKTIKFFSKTTEKHDSIVSGIDWHKNVMFSCGLDHKLKVWHFQSQEVNPELKLKQEKDIYIQDLPLSNCFYRDNSLIIGTLRKNVVTIDTQKWKPSFHTSSFLKQHKTYQNIRVSNENKETAIFSDNRISFLDKNNVFVGNLLANEPIQDVCFNPVSSRSVFAVTNDCIYEWDLRKFGIVRLQKKYLGFTSISATVDSVNIGAKLGTVYIYNINNFDNPIENNSLLNHVTQIKTNKSGELTLALSKWKANAMRVIDSMSGKAVGEWPGVKTKVGMPMQAAWNQQNFFGIGSSNGHVSVYGWGDDKI